MRTSLTPKRYTGGTGAAGGTGGSGGNGGTGGTGVSTRTTRMHRWEASTFDGHDDRNGKATAPTSKISNMAINMRSSFERSMSGPMAFPR